MGRKAVELALAESNESPTFVEFRLPVELIVRASAGAPNS
jgi:LacI family transcriptional regulator